MQCQVSQSMFDDFMRFALQYNVEHHNPPKINKKGEKQHNKANPLKHIVNEFLNKHTLERKCFKDLHVIMILNNPFDYNMRKFAVIGFVQYPHKFTKFHPFRVSTQNKYKTGLVYALEEFNKQNFDMLNLNSFDNEVLFNIPPSIHGDFDAVREHLQKQKDYEHIDFYNAFFVMFNLNNYFDILQDGVYTSENVKDTHDGLIVLLEPYYKLERLCLRINWYYFNNVLNFEFYVEDEGFVNSELSERLPPAPYREYWSISSGLMEKTRANLELNIKHSKQRVEDFKKAIELEEHRRERMQKKLDELKK